MFDLTPVRHSIVAAQLNVAMPSNNGYNSTEASENFAMFDASTPVAQLQATGDGRTDIFADLGSGTIFGSRLLSTRMRERSKACHSTAAASRHSMRGPALFAFGGNLTTNSPIGGSVFASSGEFSLTKQLALTLANTQTDFYFISLQAGQRASVGMKSLSGGGVTVTIQNAAGQTVATGAAAANLEQTINGFTAVAAGTYYVVVSATTYSTYNLAVTRDAAFDTEANNTFAAPQNLGTLGSALGACVNGDRRSVTICPDGRERKQ